MNIGNRLYFLNNNNTLNQSETHAITSKYLSESEKCKAGLMRDKRKKDIYIKSHAFKRYVLSGILKVEPLKIDFFTNSFGKPFILNETPKLFFNLSYTNGLTALIISDENETGIDVERIDNIEIETLKALVYHYDELLELTDTGSDNDKLNNFYNKWVIKEAFLKAVGLGLSFSPAGIKITTNHLGNYTIDSTEIKKSSTFHIYYHKLGNHALSYAIPYPYSTISNINYYKYDSLYRCFCLSDSFNVVDKS